ncbi:hypothetical protein SELMODRAFT_426449 [Selaginella moellendorffii]|uniref:Uncharacterized protein n=1 Tax=Selaginella moellendorffii TaxID=88036 RepID=D8SWE1_SELML|nr:hypothetical protein SELMODRAFT_426449 [Selaginella moellendorffii]
MQEPNGSRERGNAEASYSIGEAAGGSAIGGGAELGGRNEAPSAIGGGADLGGGNGGHAAALEGHRNEVVTMLEADTILNEQSHWVHSAYDLNMAIYTSFTEVFKSLPRCSNVHSKCFSQALNWWEETCNLCFYFIVKALLEGVEMPQDRDEIHIEQTEDERVENPAENSPAPSHPIAVAHSSDPTAVARPAPIARNIQRCRRNQPALFTSTYKCILSIPPHCYRGRPPRVRPLSPMGSVGNVEIVIGDYFPLCNNNILRPDHISQAVDVASKVLRYKGIMLVILPRSLFWGGLLAMMAENDDSRLVEFASGCLLSNIPVETKGAGFSMELPCSLPLLLPS